MERKRNSIVKKNKARGKKAEKRVLKKLQEHDLLALRQGIFGKEDIIFTIGNVVFSGEVKTRKSLSFLKWYEQAVSNTKEGEIPVVLCSKFHTKKWFVIIDLDDFLKVGEMLCKKF